MIATKTFGGGPVGDPIAWLLAHIPLRQTTAAEFLYERMESQSGRSLPVVYQPFDGRLQSHFADRGQILDFASVAGGERVLDFGPGDGWPSLMIAPLVGQVIGIDGSQRRVEVCRDNAARLGVTNARFVHVPPGQPLPFADGYFDGVVAASSIEQTPDPRSTLKELRRVLKPGGHLRFCYEALGQYAGSGERESDASAEDEQSTCVLFVDRHIAEEYALQVALLIGLPLAQVQVMLGAPGVRLPDSLPSVGALSQLCIHLQEAVRWTTLHPSTPTWLSWLREAGFSSAIPTYDGGGYARRLWAKSDESRRPRDMAEVDRLLRPLVEIVVHMEAPIRAGGGAWDPWITALR